jgi:hypothetical protein
MTKRSPKGKTKEKSNVRVAKKPDAKVTDAKKTKDVVKCSVSKVLLSDTMQENNGGNSILGDGTRQNQGENMDKVNIPDKSVSE